MSYGTSYSSDTWKGYLGIGALVLLVGAVITWLIMEFVCTRSFVGALVGKHEVISYSHDERETTVSTDADGNTHVSTDGEDRTDAHRRYVLTFFVDHKMREVTAGTESARVPYVRADHLALQRLNANRREPTWYTHGQLQHQYLVQVRGWLFDGTVLEMTDIATIPTE